MTVHEMKKSFVRKELLHLIRKIEKSIIGADYVVENSEEFVIVYYPRNTKKVCVTADSLSALTLDVIKAVE